MKILIGLLLMLLVITYAVGILGDPFIFIIFFFVNFWGLCFCASILFIENLIPKLSSPRIRKMYEINRMKFKVLIFLYLLFFLCCGWVINCYWLPNILHPISLLGNVGILFFAIFLGWGLVRSVKKRILFLGVVIFIPFIALLIYVNSVSSTRIQFSSVDALSSLPYATWVPIVGNIQKSGVTKHDQKRSFKGINIYTPCNLSTAYLMDMSGKRLHAWSAKIKKSDKWQHVEMDQNGNLLCIVKDRMLIKLDWDSTIKWFKKMRVHHAVAIDENEDIYVLSREDAIVFSHGFPLPILKDYIAVLSKDGKIRRKISLFKILNKKIPLGIIGKIYIPMLTPKNLIKIVKRKISNSFILVNGTSFDILHVNTLEIIDRDLYGLCKKGDLLLSVKNLNLIGILDIKNEELIWSWGQGNLSKQHHPTFLENGNILIFDNGVDREYSRIVELNPFAQKIVWEYKAKPPRQFYSRTRGASQRLPNGNTLITNSDTGHVFEVNKEWQIVWEFYNPEQKKANKKRAAIYRMMRITDPENYSRLKELK